MQEVTLPRAVVTRLCSTVPSGRSAGADLRGVETILLAEDDNAVRELARLILESQGYVVLGANRGEAALEIARRHCGPIHLLLSDVVMPGWNGRQLAERLAEIRPGMKELYMSGYVEASIIQHGMMRAGVAFLPKPFTAATLAQKVRELLDTP